MSFKIFEVGKTYPEAIGHEEAPLFDITDAGIIIPIYINRPTDEEVAQFKSDVPIKMAYVSKENVLIILMKFGNFSWIDAPYTPHLSNQLTHLPDDIEFSQGFTCHLLLFDTATGELKTQRIFSLREKMSNDLIREVKKMLARPFNRTAYAADISSSYRYTTDELVRQTRMIYRIQ